MISLLILEIGILEWFLKDHVTLKANDAEKFGFVSQE